MDIHKLRLLCETNQSILLVLPGPYGVSGGQRALWSGGPTGWVCGTTSGMDTMVEFDSPDVLRSILTLQLWPRLDGVRVATPEDEAFVKMP